MHDVAAYGAGSSQQQGPDRRPEALCVCLYLYAWGCRLRSLIGTQSRPV